MFRKVIGVFVLFLFFLVNVVVLPASAFMKEIAEYSIQSNDEKTENNSDDDVVKVAELDEFLNPQLTLVGHLNTVKESKYIYDSESILNIHISLPYPPPNF